MRSGFSLTAKLEMVKSHKLCWASSARAGIATRLREEIGAVSATVKNMRRRERVADSQEPSVMPSRARASVVPERELRPIAAHVDDARMKAGKRVEVKRVQNAVTYALP